MKYSQSFAKNYPDSFCVKKKKNYKNYWKSKMALNKPAFPSPLNVLAAYIAVAMHAEWTPECKNRETFNDRCNEKLQKL